MLRSWSASLAALVGLTGVAALILPAPSAQADPSGPACAQVLIFGLRGRGDSFRSTPMGADVQVVSAKISATLRGLGYSSRAEGVDYEAGAGAVWDTKALAHETLRGARYLQDQLSRRGRECDHAKLVVVGQSEGAGVAHVALQHLAGKVSAVVLLGDPLHEPGQSYNRRPGVHLGQGLLWSTLPTSIPPGAFSRLGSYCLPNDYVCGNGFYLPWNHAHEEYRDDRDGVASAAASFATSIVEGDLRQRTQ